MANTSAYVTAGLPYPKDSGQSPAGGTTAAYITAGLPKKVVEAAAAVPGCVIIGGGILGHKG
jgi:hypothetical protein